MLKGAYTLFTPSTGLLTSSLTPLARTLLFSYFGRSLSGKDRASCWEVFVDGL